VHLQISWIGLFGSNRDYLDLETKMFPEAFISNTNSILIGKQRASSCSLKHRWCLEKYLSFVNIAKFNYLDKMSLFPLWKFLFPGHTPFKTNSVLKGKQCARFEASNIHLFPGRNTWVSHTQLNRPIWNK
jgi:hypothetical protein